jgi:hypothetical protein
MTVIEIWEYRQEPWSGLEIGGFGVEARDGKIGKVDEVTTDWDLNALVVDTGGAWPGGKNVLLPAGVVDGVDVKERKVYVDLTKDEIENAPEFDKDAYRDAAWRERLGSYYAGRRAAAT